MGANIVDLRGIAMERLEARLDRLEDTHRSVIAAAYENLAGTNQVHRAILRMLDPPSSRFPARSGGTWPRILRVDCIRLVLESVQHDQDPRCGGWAMCCVWPQPGFVADYLSGGPQRPQRQVTLRQMQPKADALLWRQGGLDPVRGADAARFRARAACPGMLVMGAEDPHQFKPSQGTDLLAFFAGVFERTMRRWLS
jgi:uncharacterized protein